MTRIMYDSTNLRDIPRGAQVVAYYVDGLYRATAAELALHPQARKVRITTGSGTLDADVADIENGDYTAASGVAWAKRKIARDGYAALYFSAGLWAQVAAQVRAQGVNFGALQVWGAKWDGIAQLVPGWTAKQYAHPPGSGGHYDLSVVADYWPGVDPAPTTTPPVTPPPAAGNPPPDSPPPSVSNLPPAAGKPSPVQGVSDTRAAWMRLADVLVGGIVNAATRIKAAIQHLDDL